MDAKINTEMGMLDWLIVVAENLRLLILGPLIVGLLALGGAFAVPPSYVSQAILVMPAQTTAQTTAQGAAAMMVSSQVLDTAIVSLKLSDGRAPESARTELMGKIKATAGKDGVLRLDVIAAAPDQAQAIANAVINGWLKNTLPSEQERALLEKRLLYANAALDSTSRFMTQLATGGSISQKFTGMGELAAYLGIVGDLQARHLGDVLSITRQLKGLSRDDVVKQDPTLPVDPAAPKKGMIFVLGMLTSGFVLLLWVFIRQTWRNVAQDPLGAQKQARLRAVLSFK